MDGISTLLSSLGFRKFNVIQRHLLIMVDHVILVFVLSIFFIYYRYAILYGYSITAMIVALIKIDKRVINMPNVSD